MPTILRSFFAILLGYMVMMLVVIVLTLIFVKRMDVQSGHPTPTYLIINVAYSFLAAAVGGYVTAAIAKVKPIPHTAVLAAVMFFMGALSYRGYRGAQPGWYQAMMTVAPSLCAIAGGALYARNSPR